MSERYQKTDLDKWNERRDEAAAPFRQKHGIPASYSRWPISDNRLYDLELLERSTEILLKLPLAEQSGEAMEDIRYLAGRILGCYQTDMVPIPWKLSRLVLLLLGNDTYARRRKRTAREQRIIKYHEEHPEAGDRQIARELDENPGTVNRVLYRHEYERAVATGAGRNGGK